MTNNNGQTTAVQYDGNNLRALLELELLDQVSGSIYQDAPMSQFTSWKIGGPADFLISAAEVEDVELVANFCTIHQVPLTVIGRGTNLLVSDMGIEGIVLQIGDGMNQIQWLGNNQAQAQAGALLSVLSKEAAKHELTGLEWAVGIPGNVGGAVKMNAGAYGANISHYVTKVEIVEYNVTNHETKGSVAAKRRLLEQSDLDFCYRHSGVAGNQIVVGVQLKLKPGNREKSETQMRELLRARSQNQPLEYPSAGSVFVNPENDHAGRLVEAAGCKGLTVGGAQVSEKHGNFIINKGNATARDVVELIGMVQQRVATQFGVSLQTEVRRLGRR